MKKRNKKVFIFIVFLLLLNIFIKYGMTKEYFLNDAFLEFAKTNESMIVLKTIDYDTNRIFAIDRFGTVRAFNAAEVCMEESGESETDAEFNMLNMHIYQCRKWTLTPFEYINMQYRLMMIKTKNSEIMNYTYGGINSYYLNKYGEEYHIGSLSRVFGLSDEGKKYAVAWSNLIDCLNNQELQRYDEPMNNDDAWRSCRTIDNKTGVFTKKKYFD